MALNKIVVCFLGCSTKNFSMLHKILGMLHKILAYCCDMLKPLVDHPVTYKNPYNNVIVTSFS